MLFKNRKKKVKKGELRNIDVDTVSLLFDDMKPANRKGAIYKNAEGKSRVVKGVSKKYKSEEIGDKGYLYVTVTEPDVEDTQGDKANAAEVQKACDNFSKKGMLRKNDVNHNEKPVDDFFIAENYILKTEDKEHFPDTAIGSWVQVIKCENLEGELWKKVKKGNFNGVSLAGEADDLGGGDKNNDAILKGIEKSLALLVELKKSADLDDNKDVTSKIGELEAEIAKLKGSGSEGETDNVGEVLKGIEKSIKETTEAIKKAISKSIKGEPGKEDKLDKEVMVNGVKVMVKSTHKDIYKGIANVDGGQKMNILTPNTTSLFIDEVVESKAGDTLSDITVVPLIKDEKIDAGLIQDLIFKNSIDGAVSAQDVGTLDIDCPTGILNAEYTLGKDVVEFYVDKYGEQAFGAYVEQNIAAKAEKALRLLLFKGDRSSGVAKLKGLNGVVKLATTAGDVTEIDTDVYDTWVAKFEQALLGFSDELLEDQENFNIYISHRMLVKVRTELGNRQTNVGDKLILSGGKISFLGIPVKGRLIADENIVAGLTKFIIIGYRTEAELKVEHHGSDWKYHWYIRIRPGITYVPDFVKVYKMVGTPIAGNVRILQSGLNTGDVLTGRYDYLSGSDEGSSTFRWLISANALGTFTAISGATASTYSIVAGDATKYIKFEVTPVASDGVAGTPVVSAAVGPCTNA